MKTEEEIIKGLEICVNNGKKLLCNMSCKNCPYLHDMLCVVSLKSDALNLIRKKNAEIEGLNAENMLTISERNAFRTSFYEVSRQLKHAKSEAVREFAKRLKKDACYFGRAVAVEDIDNIAEEMVGDTE